VKQNLTFLTFFSLLTHRRRRRARLSFLFLAGFGLHAFHQTSAQIRQRSTYERRRRREEISIFLSSPIHKIVANKILGSGVSRTPQKTPMTVEKWQICI